MHPKKRMSKEERWLGGGEGLIVAECFQDRLWNGLTSGLNSDRSGLKHKTRVARVGEGKRERRRKKSWSCLAKYAYYWVTDMKNHYDSSATCYLVLTYFVKRPFWLGEIQVHTHIRELIWRRIIFSQILQARRWRYWAMFIHCLFLFIPFILAHSRWMIVNRLLFYLLLWSS